MKKITSLFAALMAVVAVNAATVTFGSADLSTSAMTKSGVTVTPAKAPSSSTNNAINTFEGVKTLRIYADATLTIDAGTNKITSVTLKLNSATNGKRLTTMTSDAGEVTVTGNPDWTATWTNEGVNKVVFTVGEKATLGSENTKAGQIHIMEIIVVTDGEGGGNEGGDEEEGDYSFEPTEVTTITETMNYADYSTEPDYNLIDLYMESETATIELWLFADDVTNGIPAGTYTINNSMESNTAMASPGGDELYDYPCYLATDFTEEGYTAAYYLTTGTVTITKDAANYKVVVAATSYNGSTINATYEGEIEEYIADGVENVEASALNIRMNNGNLIVGAEAGEQVSVYNVAGQMLYNIVATGETTIRGLQANQVVVVRVADKAAKVIL